MMGRTKIWAVAAAMAVLPNLAFAQAPNDISATTAKAPVSAPATGGNAGPQNEDQGTTARSVAPAVSAERAATEAATTPQPMLPGAPAAPAGSAGGAGSTSEALDAAANPDGFPRMTPTPNVGQPDGGWNLQDQHTEIGHYGRWFNDVLLLPLMAVVTLIVFGLLAYVMFRFAAKRNPVASRTSHNTLIEIVWTVVPVLILVVIAVPSFRLLADQYDPPKPDLTIKAIGHQWYWEYEYPDYGGFTFDALMLSEEETAKQGTPRLLDTDNRVIVPAGAVVKVLTTSVDVAHSWAMPSFWVKMDAIPGRINETWFKVDRPGVYFGQCSELCGTKHAFMPIALEVVEPAQFNAWVAAKEAENGSETPGPRFARGADGKLTVLAAAPAAAAPAAAAPAPAATPAAAPTATPAAAPAAAPTAAE
jgi:cytochrome c oxidase subunit 2